MLESKLAFFQEQRERFSYELLSRRTLGLTPKILNPVDMVFAFGKVGGMIKGLSSCARSPIMA